MKSNITFGRLKDNEINQYSDLVNNVFDEFIGKDYSEKGNIEFKNIIKMNKILERFNSGLYQYFVAREDEKIIGILEIRNGNHILLFFVKKNYHNQGIGKKLFEIYKETLIENKNVKIITVNSTIYAEKIYSKLGFIKTNELQEKNGIIFIPMEYKI